MARENLEISSTKNPDATDSMPDMQQILPGTSIVPGPQGTLGNGSSYLSQSSAAANRLWFNDSPNLLEIPNPAESFRESVARFIGKISTAYYMSGVRVLNAAEAVARLLTNGGRNGSRAMLTIAGGVAAAGAAGVELLLAPGMAHSSHAALGATQNIINPLGHQAYGTAGKTHGMIRPVLGQYHTEATAQLISAGQPEAAGFIVSDSVANIGYMTVFGLLFNPLTWFGVAKIYDSERAVNYRYRRRTSRSHEIQRKDDMTLTASKRVLLGNSIAAVNALNYIKGPDRKSEAVRAPDDDKSVTANASRRAIDWYMKAIWSQVVGRDIGNAAKKMEQHFAVLGIRMEDRTHRGSKVSFVPDARTGGILVPGLRIEGDENDIARFGAELAYIFGGLPYAKDFKANSESAAALRGLAGTKDMPGLIEIYHNSTTATARNRCLILIRQRVNTVLKNLADGTGGLVDDGTKTEVARALELGEGIERGIQYNLHKRGYDRGDLGNDLVIAQRLISWWRS